MVYLDKDASCCFWRSLIIKGAINDNEYHDVYRYVKITISVEKNSILELKLQSIFKHIFC